MPEQTQIPRIIWAQQRETVFLTIAVPDIDRVVVKFNEDSVYFHGQTISTNENIVYAVNIDLYDKIDTDACKYTNIGQKYWRLLLKKKDSQSTYWPRLTKDKARLHWLQTDFDHWQDEDESDDEKGNHNNNFQDMFSGNMGEGEDDEDDEDDDEDDESDVDENSPDDSDTMKTSTKHQSDN